MKHLVRIALAAAGVVGAALPSHAGLFDWWNRTPVVRSVPEIDATTGALAIAAVAAMLAFVAERRRNQR